MSELYKLYKRCLTANFTHTENDGDYAVEREGDVLYILFQETSTKTDWKNNFDFPARPYKDMDIKWRCHRGFLRVWKSIKPYLKDVIADSTVKQIYVIGYSMGAALATFCHEYVWFNRPDLRENGLEGFGFGCPRVYFGRMKKALKERWEHFHPIRNCNDLVTHVPPAIFGFRHVNKVFKLTNKVLKQKDTKFSFINAHYPQNYLFSLELENDQNIHNPEVKK